MDYHLEKIIKKPYNLLYCTNPQNRAALKYFAQTSPRTQDTILEYQWKLVLWAKQGLSRQQQRTTRATDL